MVKTPEIFLCSLCPIGEILHWFLSCATTERETVVNETGLTLEDFPSIPVLWTTQSVRSSLTLGPVTLVTRTFKEGQFSQ